MVAVYNRRTDFCGTVPWNVGRLASMISLTDRHKGPSTVTLAAQGLIIRLHLCEKVPLIAVDHVVNFLDCLHNRCFGWFSSLQVLILMCQLYYTGKYLQ